MNRKSEKGYGVLLLEMMVVIAIGLALMCASLPSVKAMMLYTNQRNVVTNLRTIDAAAAEYKTAYGVYPPTLLSLGGPLGMPCVPAAASACLINAQLSSGVVNGYNWQGSGTATDLFYSAWPIGINQTGSRSFCEGGDRVLRYNTTGLQITTEAACFALPVLPQ